MGLRGIAGKVWKPGVEHSELRQGSKDFDNFCRKCLLWIHSQPCNAPGVESLCLGLDSIHVAMDPVFLFPLTPPRCTYLWNRTQECSMGWGVPGRREPDKDHAGEWRRLVVVTFVPFPLAGPVPTVVPGLVLKHLFFLCFRVAFRPDLITLFVIVWNTVLIPRSLVS